MMCLLAIAFVPFRFRAAAGRNQRTHLCLAQLPVVLRDAHGDAHIVWLHLPGCAVQPACI